MHKKGLPNIRLGHEGVLGIGKIIRILTGNGRLNNHGTRQ